MGGGKGNREEGKGGQYTANQGPEWTGIRATSQRRDFQVSKRRVPRGKGGKKLPGNKKGLPEKRWGHASLCIYRGNKRLCLGYK